MVSGCTRSTAAGRRGPGRPDRRTSFVVNPTHEQRAEADARPRRGRDRRRRRDGRGRRRRSVSETSILDAIDLAHREIQDDHRRPAATAGAGRQAEAGVDAARRRRGPRSSRRRIRARFAGAAGCGAAGARQARPVARPSTTVEDAGRRLPPRGGAGRARELGQARSSTRWSRSSSARPCSSKQRAPRRTRRSTRSGTVTCEVGLLPRTHGSALFTRGETQALVTCTLGTSEDIQIIEALEGESQQRFLLHYNFPPFSVGEVKFMRGPGRREIGHGNLARRALDAGHSRRETVPLHHAGGLRHPRVQRLLVDGHGVRRHARPHGRRRADRGPGRRRGDGPGLRRRRASRS